MKKVDTKTLKKRLSSKAGRVVTTITKFGVLLPFICGTAVKKRRFVHKSVSSLVVSTNQIFFVCPAVVIIFLYINSPSEDVVQIAIHKNRRFTKTPKMNLEEATVFEVVLDDDVSDGIKHKLDVVGICGTSEMCVDLLLILAFVQVLKLHLDVGSCFLVCV